MGRVGDDGVHRARFHPLTTLDPFGPGVAAGSGGRAR